MQVISTDADRAVAALTSEELLTISNALNEVCNALDISEFPTRMGVSLEVALTLQRQCSGLYEALRQPRDDQAGQNGSTAEGDC